MADRRTYWIITLALFMFVHARLAAQDTLNSGTVETASYNLYLQKKWPELSRLCEKGIKAGFDYYYLRMRAGIAYYESGRFRKAIPHFLKALGFNNNDDVANEYLYYAYVYAGEYEEARWLSKTFDSAFAVRIGTRNLSPLALGFAEGGVKVPNDVRFDAANYASIGLSHYVSRRFSLLHAVSLYTQNEERFTTRQYQYYVRGTVPLKKGFSLAAGFHYAYNESSYPVSYVSSIITIPGHFDPNKPPPPPNTPLPPDTHDTVYSTYMQKKFLNTYVGAVSLTRHFNWLDLTIGGTAASLDTLTHYQVNGGFMIYPFQNGKLSLGFHAYYHSSNYFKTANTAIVPSINAALGKKITLSLSYYNNTGNNTFEQTGYILNNSPDVSTTRVTAYACFRLFKHVSLYGLYSYEEKYDAGRKFPYYYNSIMAGIKFTP